MGIALNANYRIWKDNKKQTVPAPVDPDTQAADWWYDHIAKNAINYKLMGFSAILLPPSCKTQGGCANDADGYGKLDDYDIGSKNQSYTIPTRFGTAEQLRRCVAICNACGLDVYGDVVLHQYDGGFADGTYQYPSATGPKNGRFPKYASCFVGAPPRVPVDPVFNSQGNFGFGDMCSYVNSLPPDYMASNAIESGDWLIRTTGFKGIRVDDTKGMNVGFVHRYLTSRAMSEVYAFGEMFDGNPDSLNYWVWNSGMDGRCGTIDFTVHFHLQNVCDNGGSAADLLNSNCGYFRRDPLHAVTYVESPDTDLSPGENIMFNKALAYWYLLTSEGYPMVYYRDMATDPYCYGLEPILFNLNWVHENLCFGPTIPRYGDQTVCCFERTGYPGLLSAGNWDSWNRRTITVPTNFGAHVELQDYSGHSPNIWTDGYGNATFTIPSNAYGSGTSFVCFSRVGYGQPFGLQRHSTVQTFFGADDLDIGSSTANGTMVSRIWCEKNTAIRLNKLSGDGVRFSVTNDQGREVVVRGEWQGETEHHGWHTLWSYAPGSEPTAFVVEVEYMGTQALDAEEYTTPAVPLATEAVSTNAEEASAPTASWLDKLNDYAAKHGVPESDAA